MQIQIRESDIHYLAYFTSLWVVEEGIFLDFLKGLKDLVTTRVNSDH